MGYYNSETNSRYVAIRRPPSGDGSKETIFRKRTSCAQNGKWIESAGEDVIFLLATQMLKEEGGKETYDFDLVRKISINSSMVGLLHLSILYFHCDAECGA